jgi:pilus assembly protein Flp/PilA
MIERFIVDERGQGLVEYGLLIALVAILAFAALQLLGRRANNMLSNAANYMS